MDRLSVENKIYFTLRIASAMCFIGHGIFGIITKAVWCNYFAVFGIGHALAYQLMPILGCVDILMGISLLTYPTRAIASWLVIWGLVTACLRPLSGEPFAELVERAGNFGAPFVLLLLCRTDVRFSGGFEKMKAPNHITPDHFEKLKICLRFTAFLLLAGHGWLNFIGKKALLGQYASLGFSQPHNVAMFNGLVEIVAALLILVRPSGSLILIFLAWKIATELFYPHYELFEWIERSGSYGTLLALWFTLSPSVWHIKKDTSSSLSQPVV